jgi:hypothetical protein
MTAYHHRLQHRVFLPERLYQGGGALVPDPAGDMRGKHADILAVDRICKII